MNWKYGLSLLFPFGAIGVGLASLWRTSAVLGDTRFHIDMNTFPSGAQAKVHTAFPKLATVGVTGNQSAEALRILRAYKGIARVLTPDGKEMGVYRFVGPEQRSQTAAFLNTLHSALSKKKDPLIINRCRRGLFLVNDLNEQLRAGTRKISQAHKRAIRLMFERANCPKSLRPKIYR